MPRMQVIEPAPDDIFRPLAAGPAAAGEHQELRRGRYQQHAADGVALPQTQPAGKAGLLPTEHRARAADAAPDRPGGVLQLHVRVEVRGRGGARRGLDSTGDRHPQKPPLQPVSDPVLDDGLRQKERIRAEEHADAGAGAVQEHGALDLLEANLITNST